ncbi:hypothetical protein MLD38_010531 [Melastoma candidum]|uniref:Uncharacterized protein n=1 Tax=Melastoma candidum TaxID=119954 RepID=A0ACB9R062_9MYRT|nr:hypothetical protein MLD38_010531 [Melastoma candidum]
MYISALVQVSPVLSRVCVLYVVAGWSAAEKQVVMVESRNCVVNGRWVLGREKGGVVALASSSISTSTEGFVLAVLGRAERITYFVRLGPLTAFQRRESSQRQGSKEGNKRKRKMERLRFGAVTLSLLLTTLFISLSLSSFGGRNEFCVSKGGRFLPYPLAGKAPGKALGLTFCRVFRGRTCCGVEQTHSALLSVRKLAVNGEASQECVDMWELLECSICDPKIGVQPGPPLICASLCDRIFHACLEAYFGRDFSSRDLAPCSPGELVCAKASYLFPNGTELCNAVGFSVMSDDAGNMELSEEYCYGSRASLDTIQNSWKSSRKNHPEKSKKEGFSEEALSWGQSLSDAGEILTSRRFQPFSAIRKSSMLRQARETRSRGRTDDPRFKKNVALVTITGVEKRGDHSVLLACKYQLQHAMEAY